VWDREVRGWSRGGGIQHIKDQLDVVDSSARWHIVTYDQLVSRTETWRIRDASEEAAVRLFATKKKLVIQKSTDGQKTLKLDRALAETPDFDDSARRAAWNRMMKRLNGALMAQLVALAGPTSLLVIDEAHRTKNHDSKRASAARRLAFAYPKRILLTGTPLRNTTQDASELLSILDANARAALRKSKGYTIQDVKDYLEHFMIRRLKSDVLPELPPKTRSRVDIDQLSETELDDYR
jgi:type I site-specific restriction-modification system R (restriction) subunit